MLKERFNITTAMCYAENHHVRILGAIDYDVLADGKTPRPDAEVAVTGAPQVGMAGKEEKSGSEGINQAVRNFDATALFGDLIPNIVQVGGSLQS